MNKYYLMNVDKWVTDVYQGDDYNIILESVAKCLHISKALAEEFLIKMEDWADIMAETNSIDESLKEELGLGSSIWD